MNELSPSTIYQCTRCGYRSREKALFLYDASEKIAGIYHLCQRCIYDKMERDLEIGKMMEVKDE